MLDLDVPASNTGRIENNLLPLIDKAAPTVRPLIISSGMAIVGN